MRYSNKFSFDNSLFVFSEIKYKTHVIIQKHGGY